MKKKKRVKKKTVKVTRSNKTPPFPAYPDWTTSKFWGFIRSGLRSKFTRWPPKYEALLAARRNVGAKKTSRQKYEYKCAECKKWFKGKEVEVDHIVPAGSLKCGDDLAGFVERVFCGKDKLQVLCKPCHKAKTAEERKK